ncbi:hypothetical protein [Proteus terrae]|uniref:MrpH family fimbial adhesin n=1 Tax=Proteus terrae TaxID=1574161 RepID=UPI0022456AFA|nr:hypothetical protein [Proteus terrae]MCW9689561.1 hypothetical protein [Proteus terrae]
MKRIQQILKLLIVVYGFWLFSAQAGYFTYITKSGVSPDKDSDIRYEFVMEYWTEIGYTPNPCKSLGLSRSCYIQINHFHRLPNIGGTKTERRVAWKCNVDLQHLNSMAEIRDVAMNQCGLSLPFSGYSDHLGKPKVDECIAFFMTKSFDDGSGFMVPGGVCGIAPPPEGKCAFVSSNLNISHGVLDVTQVNGNEAEEQFALICNEDMPVKITSSMDDHFLNLKPDGSIRSFLTLNGSPASIGTRVDTIKNQYVYVNIKSKLQTYGTPSLGNFSGTTTLVLSIP